MPIRVLSPEVVARIAAGEVVERPASVVKELVENSLDAGATQVAVETRGGGIGLIQVVDNGSGIPAGELETAFERHATSKLSAADDLESISSLGFRGEALASMAAVAEVEAVTCAAGEDGSYVAFKEGRVAGQGGRARPTGTTLTVRNLFRNVPARLKFLKSAATENGHIAQAVSQYSLAYPEVKFTLVSDGRTVLSTPGTGRLADSVLAVHGLDTARNMLEIKADAKWGDSRADQTVGITGLVGAPAVSRASRDYISFFVNRRWISSALLMRALEDAYHGLVTVGQHPVAVVNITMPAREVDVNIHPAKRELKFQDERRVFGAVQRAVRATLVEVAPVPVVEQPAAVYSPPQEPSRPLFAGWTPPPPGEEFSGILPVNRAVATTPWKESLPALRLLGQLAASYIVAEGPDGLYLIDQHAAHERIRFERIRRQRAEQKVEVQGLLEPITFEATPRQEALLKTQLPALAAFGFSLEPFGGTAYLVRAVPAGMDGKDCLAALRELLDSPQEGGPSTESWTEKIAISIACHGGIRAGQVLSVEEMRQLVRELEQTDTPHTCPHGRPTMTRLTIAQLEREFKRT